MGGRGSRPAAVAQFPRYLQAWLPLCFSVSLCSTLPGSVILTRLFSPLCSSLLPPGRGVAVSWARPCPWLWPLCAVCGGCTGGGLWLRGWKLFSPIWNAGNFVWGPLRFFQTSVLLQRALVSPFCKSRVRVGFFRLSSPEMERSVSR